MARREGATVFDVAALAQVSAQTVSRVLNERGYVSEDARARVRAAVETLRYRPNVIGRSLRSARTPMVGLLVSDIANPFYARLHRALEQPLREAGLSVFLLNCDDDADVETRQLELLAAYRPTGLVLAPAAGSRFDEAAAARFENVVLVSRTLDGLDLPTVVTDETESFAAAIAELLDHGHRRLGVVFGRADVSTTRLREAGLRAALARRPDAEAVIRYSDGDVESARIAAAELLADPAITAIACFNVAVTEGVLTAMREAAVRCPDDVSIVGFTDAGWFAAAHPGITAVAQPIEEMGRLAGDLIVRMARGERPAAAPHLVAAGRLIRRESVAAPKERIR